MKTAAILVVSSVLFFISSALSSRQAPELTGRVVGRTGLVVKFADLNVGRVPNDRYLNHAFRVRNPTGRTIDVKSIVTSCSCTKVEPSEFSVPPGEAVEVGVRVSVSQFGRVADEPIDFAFEIQTSDEGVGVVNLEGIAFAPIRVSTTQLTFTNPIALGHSAVTNTIAVELAPEVTSLTAEAPNDLGVVRQVQNDVESSGRSRRYCVELLKSNRVGGFSFPVAFKAKLGDDPKETSLVVPCVGARVSEIKYWPESLTLTAEADGRSSSSEEINIWTESGARPTSLAVRCSEGRLLAERSASSRSDLSTFTISAPPASESGSETAEVMVSGIIGPNNVPFEVMVPVAVYYFAAANTAERNESSQEFPPVTE